MDRCGHIFGRQSARQCPIYLVLVAGKQFPREGFASAAGYVKRTLASRLGLRYMPEIRFQYDESFDYGERIERVFKTLHTENGSDHLASE